MVTIKSKILCLIVCLVEMAWLLVAQIVNSQFLIIPCLACFLIIAVWASVKGFAVPVMLFFLPFSPILKLRPGTVSFFTIALILVYLVYIAMGSRKISITHFVPGLALIGLVLAVKVIGGYPLENYFILFSLSLLMVPFMVRELDDNYDFYWLTLFFSIGIIVAAVSAKLLVGFPTISSYVTTHSIFNTLRWSGYYGDPNFYSAQITAALSGVMIMLLAKNKKRDAFMWTALLLVLLYCGLLSISKSFFLVAGVLGLLWVGIIMFRRGNLTAKIVMIVAIIVGIIVILSVTVFRDMIDSVIARFAGNLTWSDFTTRRTDLWLEYLKGLADDPWVFWFGIGYTDIIIGSQNSHSTVIQSIYQLGLIGTILLVLWEICYINTLKGKFKVPKNYALQAVLLYIGTLGPWVALDYLFFDEFFILPIYVCAGIRYMTKQKTLELDPVTQHNDGDYNHE